jgi:hypothetical protein
MGVACSIRAEMRNANKILFAKAERTRLLRRFGINRRTILKQILKKWGLRMWNGFIWLRIGTGCGLL